MFSRAALFICDMQRRVLPRIINQPGVVNSISTLIDANKQYRKAKRLEMGGLHRYPGGSVVLAEYLPTKLGKTDESILRRIPRENAFIFEKPTYTMFSDSLDQYLKSKGIKEVALTGVQTEWCVTQTAKDLQKAGYDVSVIKDAVSSTNDEEHFDALERLRRSGIDVVSTHGWIAERIRTEQVPINDWYINHLKQRAL